MRFLCICVHEKFLRAATFSKYKKTGSKGCLFFYQYDKPFFLLREYMESKKFFRQVFSDHCVDILEPKDGIVRPHAMPLGKIGGVVA